MQEDPDVQVPRQKWTLIVDGGTAEAIRRLARANRRSLTAQANLALEEHAARHREDLARTSAA